MEHEGGKLLHFHGLYHQSEGAISSSFCGGEGLDQKEERCFAIDIFPEGVNEEQRITLPARLPACLALLCLPT